MLTGRGPRCECFCRAVPLEGQHLKDLEHFLAVMRARFPCLQVRSDNEEALKHVLKDACEQVHLEYRNTRLETPASNSVRAMKEMIQRQKDAVFTYEIEFFIKHSLFALLVRHSEWILNHLLRNDFLVELDNRVIKTSNYESPLEILLRDQLRFSIVSWSVDVTMTTNNHDFSKLGFSV